MLGAMFSQSTAPHESTRRVETCTTRLKGPHLGILSHEGIPTLQVLLVVLSRVGEAIRSFPNTDVVVEGGYVYPELDATGVNSEGVPSDGRGERDRDATGEDPDQPQNEDRAGERDRYEVRNEADD